jgi:Flp pilus assembly protein TadD
MMGTKDYANALKYYQAAASLDPNSSAAFQGEGTCYYYMGQKDQARDAFTKALALNPSNTSLQSFINALK